MSSTFNHSQGNHKTDQQKPKTAWLGQLFFSSMSHSLYDVGLYRFVTGTFWRCPTERLVDNYADNITHKHLEIGVGSGYFLHHTLCAEVLDRLTLLDLNKRCLQKSAERLREYKPTTLHQSAAESFAPKVGGFASVGMNYVLHCVPGSFTDNKVIFENIHAALGSGGVLFGATLLPRCATRSLASRVFMRLLNLVRIFHNDAHTTEDLGAVLDAVFSKVELTQVGDAVIFRAVKSSAENEKELV